MIDLESAGRRLVNTHRADPPPIGALHRRAEIRRRRQFAVASVAAVLAAAAGIGLVAGGRSTRPVAVVGPTTGGGTRTRRVTLRSPEALAVASDGDLLIDNVGTDQILRRSPSGALSVLAGTGRAGYSGDGGPASQAELDQPGGIAVGPDGTVYVADTFNDRIRAISPDGLITTIAGDGASTGSTIGPARRVAVDGPSSVAVGPDGRIYLTDNAGVQVLAGGTLETVLSAGADKLTIDHSPTAWVPSQIAVSTSGDLYVADSSPKLLVETHP